MQLEKVQYPAKARAGGGFGLLSRFLCSIKPRGVGQSGRITSSSITTRSTKAGTSRRGNSRSSSQQRFGRPSGRSVSERPGWRALRVSSQ